MQGTSVVSACQGLGFNHSYEVPLPCTVWRSQAVEVTLWPSLRAVLLPATALSHRARWGKHAAFPHCSLGTC